MSLRLVMQSLAWSVRRYESTYRSACSEEPTFAPYPTANALLATLKDQSALPLPQRQTLVAALILRYQATRHPLWQLLLLGAFQPLLGGLRQRDRGNRSDRDQRVLAAFLQALGSVRVEGQLVFLAVSRATARALFRAVRAERDMLDHAVPLDEPRATPSHDADAPPFTVCLAHEIAAHIAQQRGGEDVVRVLVGLETEREQFARLAAPAPGGAAERITAGCIYKRRRRAVAEVRAMLAPEPESTTESEEGQA
jgi:hypothetical protein